MGARVLGQSESMVWLILRSLSPALSLKGEGVVLRCREVLKFSGEFRVIRALRTVPSPFRETVRERGSSRGIQHHLPPMIAM
jgi:hypothetical protein